MFKLKLISALTLCAATAYVSAVDLAPLKAAIAKDAKCKSLIAHQHSAHIMKASPALKKALMTQSGADKLPAEDKKVHDHAIEVVKVCSDTIQAIDAAIKAIKHDTKMDPEETKLIELAHKDTAELHNKLHALLPADLH